MITISDNIKVCVSTPSFCDFYNKITLYANQLHDNFDHFSDEYYELIRLNVFNVGNTMNEEYVLSNSEGLFKISFISDLVKRTGHWEGLQSIEETDESLNRDLAHIFDIEHFIQNN